MAKQSAKDAACIWVELGNASLAVFAGQDLAVLANDATELDRTFDQFVQACKVEFRAFSCADDIVQNADDLLKEPPEILLVKLPTSTLSAPLALHIRRVLQAYSALGKTLVTFSNKVEDIVPSTGRVALVKDGELLAQGTKKKVVTKELLQKLFGDEFELHGSGLWYRSNWQPQISSAHENPFAKEPPALTKEQVIDVTDELFMKEAMREAELAAELGEVPIGAVVVHENKIIARAHNTRESELDPAGHAEFSAMLKAAEVLGRWRLTGCTVYVTLEPCLMCAGLMLNARIDRCVFAAYDPKGGALGSLYQLYDDVRLNHSFSVSGGILEADAKASLQSFFQKRRKSE